MTKHIDKFGREWNYTPGHDADRMIRVPSEIMRLAYDFHYQMRNLKVDCESAHTKGWHVPVVDCYLLKGNPDSKYDSWYAGIRCSDEGSDYLSPYFDMRVVEFMLECLKNHRSLEDAKAYWELVGGGV